jgi:hypothetical protein
MDTNEHEWCGEGVVRQGGNHDGRMVLGGAVGQGECGKGGGAGGERNTNPPATLCVALRAGGRE